MERSILLTGIGGQGVQLSAQVLARAALREGHHVQYLGTYGGMMRGGNTDSTVVIGDAPIESPPLVSDAWSALVMHHEFWEPLRPKLGDGSVLVLNSSLFEGQADRERQRVFDIPATQQAIELGAAVAASMILLGAWARITAMVGIDALVATVPEALPPYRQQHVSLNEKALRIGWESAPDAVAPGWDGQERSS